MPGRTFAVQHGMDFDDVTLDFEIDHIRKLLHERSLIAAAYDFKHLRKLTDGFKARVHSFQKLI